MGFSDDVLTPAQEAAFDYLWNYFSFIAPVIMFYDTILTFSTEVEVIWKRKFKVAAFLYVLVRYSLVIYMVLDIVNTMDENDPDQLCTNLFHAEDFFWLLSLIGMEGLQMARVYAISHRNNKIFFLFGPLFLGLIISQLYHTIIDFCDEFNDLRIYIANALSMGFLVVLESSILVVTVFYTLTNARRLDGISTHGSMISLFLRQGIFYYMIVATLTTTSMILDAKLDSTISGIQDTLPQVLCGIIICRFLLEIRSRKPGGHLDASPSTFGSSSPNLNFSKSVKATIMEEFSDEIPSLVSDRGIKIELGVRPEHHMVHLESDASQFGGFRASKQKVSVV